MLTTKPALNVNGRRYELNVDARVTLLDVLRESLGLCGTKKGCDQGQCGACTVPGKTPHLETTLGCMHARTSPQKCGWFTRIATRPASCARRRSRS